MALGRPEAAAALLGAGAAVRPQAWAALAASHCPAPCKDTLAALLVARHVRACLGGRPSHAGGWLL